MRFGCSSRVACGALVVAFACASTAIGAERGVVRRRIPVGGAHGSLSVLVPSDWKFEAFARDNPPSATVRFGPRSGEFEFTLVLLWTEPSMRVPPDVVKERVRRAAQQALSEAIETDAKLVEVRGSRTAGWSYSLTGRASSKMRYSTRGIAVTGPIMDVFTLLSRSPDHATRERALRVIASATWSDAVPGALVHAAVAPAPESGSLRIDETGEAYRLTVPVSHFVLAVRKGELKMQPTQEDRSARHFLFQDDDHGTVVSGWFGFSEQYDGLEKLWEREKRRSSADPEDVKFTKVGAWDAIVYQEPVPGGTTAHVRAEWVAEGTWIDLHLSTTGKRSAAEARASLLQQLEAFRVEDKD